MILSIPDKNNLSLYIVLNLKIVETTLNDKGVEQIIQKNTYFTLFWKIDYKIRIHQQKFAAANLKFNSDTWELKYYSSYKFSTILIIRRVK